MLLGSASYFISQSWPFGSLVTAAALGFGLGAWWGWGKGKKPKKDEFKPNYWALPLMILIGVALVFVAGVLGYYGVFEALWGGTGP